MDVDNALGLIGIIILINRATISLKSRTNIRIRYMVSLYI